MLSWYWLIVVKFVFCITKPHFFALVGKEKAPYEAKAAKRKADYEKQMKAYNKKQVGISYILYL